MFFFYDRGLGGGGGGGASACMYYNYINTQRQIKKIQWGDGQQYVQSTNVL